MCVFFLAALNKDELQEEAVLEAAVQTHLLCSLYRGFCGSDTSWSKKARAASLSDSRITKTQNHNPWFLCFKTNQPRLSVADITRRYD